MNDQLDLLETGVSNKRRRISHQADGASSGPPLSFASISDLDMVPLAIKPHQSPKGTGSAFGSRGLMSDDAQRLSWPAFVVPPEIFHQILNFLTRRDAKNMRLVNREFEFKISAAFFSNVVVPFTAELYSSRPRALVPDPLEAAEDRIWASERRSEGLRIFQSFGHQINRFALCLELDEEHLANPPVKVTQHIVPAFWGLYRWPNPTYTRFDKLQGIEDTADELGSMKTALKCLTNVNELGLCFDAGLGYLTGPERNSNFNPGPHPVFRTWNKDHLMDEDPQPETRSWKAIDRLREPGDPLKSLKLDVLEAMIDRVGVPAEQIDEAVSLLLDSEGVNIADLELDDLSTIRLKDSGATNTLGNAYQAAAAEQTQMNYPLLPMRLTQPQNEMLLEMDWALRALMQTFVLAVADLGNDNHFTHLTTLTIAKVPSSHIDSLKSHSFWRNLPSLEVVSFAVIPDWRTMKKPANSSTQSGLISPVLSVGPVFQLLRQYVGERPNITSIHFEWLCGGEFAPGCNQRDRFVLPAPLCLPADMVLPDTPMNQSLFLVLPHIRHLSLKNCYATPHVFMQVIRSMALLSLDSLELVSVSLTGPPRKKQKDDFQELLAVYFGNAGMAALNLGGPIQGPGGVLPFGFANPVAPLIAGQHNTPGPELQASAIIADNQRKMNHKATPGSFYRVPRLFSWSGFIEHFTPGRRVQDTMPVDELDPAPAFYDAHHMGFLPPPALAQERGICAYKLKSISFKSCGYVSIKAPHINTVAISSIRDLARREAIRGDSLRDRDLTMYLQVTSDPLAASIIPDLDPVDENILRGFHHMAIGWEGNFPRRVIASAAADDGFRGSGRFSGVLGTPSRALRSCHPDYVVRS